MNSLVFTAEQQEVLSAALFVAKGAEAAAIVTGTMARAEGSLKYLVQNVHVPPINAYRTQSQIGVEIAPEYFVPVVRQARGENRFVGFIHTHPFSDFPEFSSIDDATERKLLDFLRLQFNSDCHVAAVVGQHGWKARELGTSRDLRVISVGNHWREWSHVGSANINLAFDRQLRAFGREGQDALQRARIGIVGLGGTGSVVAQALAYLGARFLRLIDFDVVDVSNINRLIGATRVDIGLPKVEVVARHARLIDPDCVIDPIRGDVLDDVVARQLLDCDLIFSCTDSHGSRAVLNQLAYQFYVPCFDVGVAIAVKDSTVTHIAGRAQALAPGLGCLTCGNLLDADEVRRDLMTPVQRRQDPYFVGAVVPQPAIVSINTTVASLAVSMYLGTVARIPLDARLQVYDGIRGTVRSAQIGSVDGCVVCSRSGALGRGDTWPLPTRKAAPFVYAD
jgi:molybdopterin-synthase adenylyltransferase